MRCDGALWSPPGSFNVALAKRSAMVWQGIVKNYVGLNVSLYHCQLEGQLKKGNCLHGFQRQLECDPLLSYPFPLKSTPVLSLVNSKILQ